MLLKVIGMLSAGLTIIYILVTKFQIFAGVGSSEKRELMSSIEHGQTFLYVCVLVIIVGAMIEFAENSEQEEEV